MPTYDFICSQCKHAFEFFASIKGCDSIKCPCCGADTTRKVSGGSGVIYRGSGFYTTDYNPVK